MTTSKLWMVLLEYHDMTGIDGAAVLWSNFGKPGINTCSHALGSKLTPSQYAEAQTLKGWYDGGEKTLYISAEALDPHLDETPEPEQGSLL